MDQDAKDKIIKARVGLQKTHPFFSYLALHLAPIETTEIPTMGVDKRGNMWYNPEFVNKMTQDEVKGVVCHEIMHVALEHLNGLKGKDAQVSNVAMDIVVNDIIMENGLRLPKEGIIPQNHEALINGNIKIKDINKKCWEIIYAELEKKLPKKKVGSYGFDEHTYGDGKDDGKGQGGGPDGKGKKLPAGVNDKDFDAKQTVNEAYAYAKLQGMAPAGMDRYIEELSYPKMDWKSMLRKFIVREIPFNYNYSRPSKRSIACGIFMPSVVKESLEIGVAVDTSGSMSPDDLKLCVSEVLGIIKAYDNVKLTVLSCDAEVHTVAEVTCEEDVASLKLEGGGGTDFRPVFEWIGDNKPAMKLLVFFTDGYGEFPKDAPSTKVLWCVSKGGLPIEKIPFGESVELDVREQEEV
jgi:predicted metal-dependent peptidase